MKYLRRLVWFIAAKLLALLLILGILSTTFYFAMNAMNIYIIIKDGMAARAKVIMMDESSDTLNNYFFSSWIARDELLQSAFNDTDPYQSSTVTGFDHRITLKWVWCWPWENTARATVIERIPAIDGKNVSEGSVPAWQNGQYAIILYRDGGNWKIRNITLLERLSE